MFPIIEASFPTSPVESVNGRMDASLHGMRKEADAIAFEQKVKDQLDALRALADDLGALAGRFEYTRGWDRQGDFPSDPTDCAYLHRDITALMQRVAGKLEIRYTFQEQQPLNPAHQQVIQRVNNFARRIMTDIGDVCSKRRTSSLSPGTCIALVKASIYAFCDEVSKGF